ncbi:MIF4G domain-containing protein A [Danio rerio]|uniref:MIF4G domain-containing protein A n=1 Tax=Danio rerio TaxID=7955 RepID=UPI00001A3DC8|nr:MIF4G domain-containing protein A [Danio rerio]AAH53283.1 MIF4G domain containing a [Danio rerio]|eukprot:NP_956678.1 MIF4G domain-containing protein A [Danio rerio]
MDSAWTALDMETQTMLKTAIKDPKTVDLEKLSNAVVEHSLKDLSFCKDAGRMCYAVVQAEAQKTASSVFRRNLLNRLQQEFIAREETRKRSMQEWVCVVTFICSIFDYIKVNNSPIAALVDPVYDCLFRLAQPDSLMNEEEVDCLVVQLHRVGEQLEQTNSERMNQLFYLLRDGFLLQEDLSSMTRLLLLEILEFRASGWTLSETAHKYYYSEVAD